MLPPLTVSNITSGIWNRTDSFQVVLTATTSDPAGIRNTYWSVDGGTTNVINNTAHTNPFVTSFTVTGNGLHTVSFYSDVSDTDIELIKIVELKLDNEIPVSSYSVSYVPDGTNNWYITNPIITLSVTESISGVKNIWYRWNNAPLFSLYTAPFQIQNLGNNLLEYYSEDNAGNVESVKNATFLFDNTKPVTEDNAPEGVQKVATTVKFFYSDTYSGVIKTYYTTDGSVPTLNSSSGSEVLLSETGDYIIKYFSVDYAGNQEAVKTSSVQVIIDTSAPTVNISESFDINGSHGWWRTTPTITLTSADSSGIQSIQKRLYPTGKTTTAKCTGTVDLSNGIDLSSNWLINLVIDGGTPTEIDLRGTITTQTTASEIVNAINSSIGSIVASETNIQGETGTGYVTITSPTAGNQSAEVQFIQPSGKDATTIVFGLTGAYPYTFLETVYFSIYSSPFTIPSDGSWTLEAYATDLANNQGKTISKIYQLDSTVSNTEINVEYPPDGNNNWYKTKPKITLLPTDATSGIWRTFWQWDNGIMYQYAGEEIIFPSTGKHTLNCYSIDIAGNIEGMKSKDFFYDISIPETTDDSWKFQGIIQTAFVSGNIFVANEQPLYDSGTTLKLAHAGCVSVVGGVILNYTKGTINNPLEYKVLRIGTTDISTNTNQILEVYPLTKETASNTTTTTITVTNTIAEVVKVFNITTNTEHTVNIFTGQVITLNSPILLTDVIEVTYSFIGMPLSPSDVISVSYYYNLSASVNVLNTQQYTFITPAIQKINDFDVTVTLTPFDPDSGISKTYYTTDGSTPTTSSSQGTSIFLTENGTYIIKYFSVDNAGNTEGIKTAQYSIIIDKDIPIINTYFDRPINNNGWFNKDFGIISEIYTDNLTQRIGYRFDLVTDSYAVETGVNDAFDWDEGSGENNAIIPSITVTATNKYVNVNEINLVGVPRVISVPEGVYTPEGLSVALASALNVGTTIGTYNVDYKDRRYTISNTYGTDSFNLLWLSGANHSNSMRKLLGFYEKDSRDGNFVSTTTSDEQVKTRIEYNASDLVNVMNNSVLLGYTTSLSIIANGQFQLTTSSSELKLLWTKSSNSIANLLGFDSSSDLTGLDTYDSQWYRYKSNVEDKFLKSFSLITKNDTPTEVVFEKVDKGASGFYDEILISTPIAPAIGDYLKADYFFYTGIDKAEFGLDDSTPEVYPIFDDLEVFEELSSVAKIIGKQDTPTVIGNRLNISFNGSEPKDIDITGISGIDNIINKINAELLTTIAYKTDINGVISPSGTYISLISSETGALSEIILGVPTTGVDATYDVFKITAPYSAIRGTKFKVTYPARAPQFFLQEAHNTLFSKAIDKNSISLTGIPPKVSNLTSISYGLDTVKPVSTDNIGAESYKQSFTVILSATDSLSGIDAIWYSLNNVEPLVNPVLTNNGSISIPITASGQYTVRYYAIDKAGNKEDLKQAVNQVWIDSTAPETILSTTPEAIPDGLNGWYVTPETVQLFPSDSDSGVLETRYRVGSGQFQLYIAPFAIPEGDNKVEFYSVDNVGNVETTKTVHVKIDSVKPITTTNIPISGWYNNSKIDFTITDTASGGYKTYFTVDGSTPTITPPTPSTPDTSYTFPNSGTYTLKYFSVDNAGNTENLITQILYLDIDKPIIDNFIPAVDPLTNLPTIDESTTAILFDVKDIFSGVDINSVIFEVDGIEYSTTKNSSYFNYASITNGYTITISPIQNSLNFENIGLISIYAKDNVGNEATPVIFDYNKQDKQPPRIRELNPIPNAQDVSTKSNIMVHLTDDQSGVDIRSVVVTVNTTPFKISTVPIFNLKWTGNSSAEVIATIQNNYLITTVNGVLDLSFSFVDEKYNTVIKVAQYIDGLANYSCEIINSDYEQYPSVNILSEVNVNINNLTTFDFFIPENNLNFSYIERENGYLVFVTPNFSFDHKVVVNVRISASDNAGNAMNYAYAFIPHITASYTVEERNWRNTEALTYIKDIQDYIPSNYTRSQSTNFYQHHKAIGLELAKVTEILELLAQDASYTTVRPEYLWQKLGYLLKFDPQAIFSHDDYRRILLTLIQIYFAGSKKTAIEQGIALFTQGDVKIIETFLLEGYDISDQFTFSVDVMLGNSRLLGLDLQAIIDNINLILRTTRPAHTYYLLRYIWTEMFMFGGACIPLWVENQFGQPILDQFGNKIPLLDNSGFQQVVPLNDTSICDVYKIEQEYDLSEDLRIDCRGNDEEIKEYVEDVSIQFTGTENVIETYNKPILKAGQPPEMAQLTSDVIVTVNGNPAVVTEIDPENGLVTLAITPLATDVVVITYHWNPYYVYRHLIGYLNDYIVLGNDFDTTLGTIFNTFNVNDFVGGISHSDQLHAHVCETDLSFQINDDLEGDKYSMPDCEISGAEFFFLNTYTVDGIDFVEKGSYLNNLLDIGWSVGCSYYDIEIDDFEQELPIPAPIEDWTDIVIDGRGAGDVTGNPITFMLFGDPQNTGILNESGNVLIGVEGLTYDRYESRNIQQDLTELTFDHFEEIVRSQIFGNSFILNDSLLNDGDSQLLTTSDTYTWELDNLLTDNYSNLTDSVSSTIIDSFTDSFVSASDVVETEEIILYFSEDVRSQIFNKNLFILNTSLTNSPDVLAPYASDTYTVVVDYTTTYRSETFKPLFRMPFINQ